MRPRVNRARLKDGRVASLPASGEPPAYMYLDVLQRYIRSLLYTYTEYLVDGNVISSILPH